MICSNCVLPDAFPGISFDAGGVCNYCRRFGKTKATFGADRARYKEKFLQLISDLQRQPAQRPYDVLAAYSGGKDSSYTLKILKENFQLRILAVTFNHGFVSEKALQNIQTVCSALDVDHMMISPSQGLLCEAFRRSIQTDAYSLKTLERASSICNTCMNMTKAVLLKYAILLGIPMIGYGWSPGQAPIQSAVMKWNSATLRKTQAVLSGTLRKIFDRDWSPFTVGEKEIESLERNPENGFLYNIHPLAFWEYNEERIVAEIQTLGWENPKDTDSNSTNCLLNAFANQVHLERYGFHPYTSEIAGLVREGYMTREEGIEKLSTQPDEKVIKEVKKRLSLE